MQGWGGATWVPHCCPHTPTAPPTQLSGGGSGQDTATIATVIGGLVGVALLGYLGLQL